MANCWGARIQSRSGGRSILLSQDMEGALPITILCIAHFTGFLL